MTLPIIRHIDPWEAIIVTPLADGSGFKVLESFRCQFQTDDGTDYFLVVPPGFVTDWASMPALFRPIWKTWGWWSRAALVHDVLYHYGQGSKEMADDLFEVVLWQDQIVEEGHEDDPLAMASAVRMGGRGNFDQPRPRVILSNKGYSHVV